MPLNQISAGGLLPPASLPAGGIITAPAGKQGDQFVSELHGKWYSQAVQGNVFIGSTAAAGVVLPAFSATAVVFALWNPLGSGKNFELIRLQIGYVSGTAAPSNFALGFQNNVGAQVATGGPITAATLVAPVNALINNAAPASVARFAPATLTLASGATLLKTIGVSQLTTTAATTTSPFFSATEDFDGQIVLAPGNIIVVGGNVATTTTADVALTWAEVPV